MPESERAAVHTDPVESPDDRERYCAWYGDTTEEVLYFGQSAFWSALRSSGGRPTADLDLGGPARIGRFDLVRERLLPPLDVGQPEDRSGVWDVLAHPNGRVYFTTFFGSAGSIDPASGEVRRFDAAGDGLTELAPGPEGRLLASRYGGPGGSQSGSVAVLGPGGELVAEFGLEAPAGFITAPKTVAWDDIRRQIWVTTDQLPSVDGPPRGTRHDAYLLDEHGVELARIEYPEIQFVAVGSDGTAWFAEVHGRELSLRVVSPAEPDGRAGGLRRSLDPDFATDLDFVQDIQISAAGDAAITRWSGWVHLVAADGAIRSLRMPALGSDGLYYTGALRGDRVCATHCRDVSIVCRSVPSASP